MVKCELYKIFKSWKSLSMIIIAVILGFLHTCDAIFYTGARDISVNPYHPAFASFLNGISAKGNYRTYFLWIIPLLFIIAYSGRYAAEKSKNMDIVYYTKMNRSHYFFSKMKTAGIVGIIINLFPNLISIIMTVYFLHGKNGFMDAEQWSADETGDFAYWCVHHPYATYIIFLLSNIVIAALLGIMCQSIVIMVEDARLAMLITVAIWMGLYFGNNYFFIGNAIQPFVDENTLDMFISSYITYIPMVVVWFVAAYFKVVKRSDKV